MLALVVGFVSAGCSIDGNDPYLTTDYSKFTAIRERGSFEDAKTELDAMMNEMADAFTAEFPECPMVADFESLYSLSPGTEGEFGQSGFRYRSILWIAECSVSDTEDRRDRALPLITAIANKYGFDGPAMLNNRVTTPELDGYLSFFGTTANGDTYHLGSSKNTVLSYTMAPRYTAKQLAFLEANPDGRVDEDRPAVPIP